MNTREMRETEGQSLKGEKIMNAREKLCKVFSRATMVLLVVALVSVQAPTSARADNNDRQDHDNQTVSVPLVCTGLVLGKSLRTTLINRGTRRVRAHISVFDANGVVVKQSPLVLEPGQMSTFAISRGEVPRDELSVMLRTSLTVQRADGRNLWGSSEVVDDATGQTELVVIAIIAILMALLVPAVQ